MLGITRALLHGMPAGHDVSRFRSGIFFFIGVINVHINYTECPQGMTCLGFGRVSFSSSVS